MAPTDTGHATDSDIEKAREAIKESNADRQREKLRRSIRRAQAWRIQVWAQSEIKIRQAQASLAELGVDAEALEEPDFTIEENLHHYANMALPK